MCPHGSETLNAIHFTIADTGSTLERLPLQLQLGVDAFAFSFLLLAERFQCLRARFEELRAQTLDELEGVVEKFSPVVERTLYNAAAAEKQAPFGAVGTGFKRCR